MLDPALVRFLALNFNAAIASAARPGLTFAVIQWTVGALVRMEVVAVPDTMAWLVSVPALLIAGLLAALETWVRHDPDAAELLRELKVDHLLGAFGTFSCALLFASLGLPEDEAAALVTTAGTAQDHDMALALSLAAGGAQPVALKAAAIGGALGLHTAMSWARAQLVSFLADFDLEYVWARLETGGMVAVLLALLLAPYLAAAFLLLASAVTVGIALSIRAARYAADRKARIDCPHCAARVRPEARRCPSCGGALSPTVVLTPTTARQRWAAARDWLAAARRPAP